MDSTDIIAQILRRRKEDVAAKGWEMGCTIPASRNRAVVPFLSDANGRYVILEVKRASPSKGDIAPHLDAALTAKSYVEAGASAISVLTEEHWFKGSLDDLVAVCRAVGESAAVLRKDFLFDHAEVDVAYQCGADAVLIIARMLEAETIAQMLRRVREHSMSALIEIRTNDDVHKVQSVISGLGDKCPHYVLGVNARDLKDFSIDALRPRQMRHIIQEAMGDAASRGVITESGVRTERAARIAGAQMFNGLLLGEAAARNPADAAPLVSAFKGGKGYHDFWQRVAIRALERRTATEATLAQSGTDNSAGLPLVKICGLTRVEDAVAAEEAGADMLGFVFCHESPRCACADVVRKVHSAIEKGRILLIGVITSTTTDEGQAALALLLEGVLDAVQLHGVDCDSVAAGDYDDMPCYTAINAASKEDLTKLDTLLTAGESRVLLDAKSETALGGTGKRVDVELARQASKKAPLWLAGGITPDNVVDIVSATLPELLDIASGVEASAGVKDINKVRQVISRARAAYLKGRG